MPRTEASDVAPQRARPTTAGTIALALIAVSIATGTIVFTMN